jgi:hypothetical protein
MSQHWKSENVVYSEEVRVKKINCSSCNGFSGQLTMAASIAEVMPTRQTGLKPGLIGLADKDQKKKTPWPQSASELYRPSDRRLFAKLVPTFADRRCHVVSVTHPYGRILCILGPGLVDMLWKILVHYSVSWL